jgi:hypothetical protein
MTKREMAEQLFIQVLANADLEYHTEEQIKEYADGCLVMAEWFEQVALEPRP